MSYQEWTYHGVHNPPNSGGNTLDVEKPESGYTERKRPTVLRSLPSHDVGWGYNGTGTSQAAARILADALELGDPETAGISLIADRWNDRLRQLCEDFCDEVLMQMPDEWRLSRTAVLRWVLGWYTQLGISPMPAVLRRLPAPGTISERRFIPPQHPANP